MAEPTLSQDLFSLTNDQIRVEVLESHIHGGENYDVESLLKVAKRIINLSTQITDTYLFKDITEPILIAEGKTLPKDLTLPLHEIKQIGYQITCQLAYDQDHAHQTTMAILYELRNTNWDAKATITLAALAMEYGNFWHRTVFQATTTPLGKSLTLLNGGFDIVMLQDIDMQRTAFDQFHNLVNMVLKIIEYIIELKKLSQIGVDQGEVPELLEAIQEIPVNVYWVILTIVVCATHIGILLGQLKCQPKLSQFAEKLDSICKNLREHVTKLKQKIASEMILCLPEDAAVSQKSDLLWTETKETYPNIIFGQKQNNFSFEKVGIHSNYITPDQPSDIVCPFGKSSFPEFFIFGTATSAYQIEGAIDERGQSAWDNFIHCHPEKIKDRSNRDVACDSYNRYEEDVQLMKEMNMRAYRFSISWSRILPNGKLSGGLNQEGILYYQRLLTYLNENELIPFVTLFHMDYPQALQHEYGGFLSEEIINDFRDFARLCFNEFGHLVKHWITFNEPHTYCYAGYTHGSSAAGRISDPGREPYRVGHNMLLAHAEAVEVYNTGFKASQNGEIGIALDGLWTVPYSKDKADRDAAFRAMDFWLGWFLEPLITGAYPETMQSRVKERLPTFSDDESQKLRGSFDFIGINYYTSKFAADYPTKTDPPNYITDSGVHLTYWCRGRPIGERTASGMCNYPKGLRDLLCYIQAKCNDPSIYITGNGMATFNQLGLAHKGALLDVPRIRYHSDHLYYVLSAIQNYGIDVKGYFAWSLLDDFKWNGEYTMQLGMNFMDIINNRGRYPKLSAQWFKIFLQN